MHKIVRFFPRVFATISLVLFSVLLSPAGAADTIGQIKAVKGSAHIERAGTKIVAEIGAWLEQSDKLLTGEDGSLGVTFVDNTRFSAGPNSVISLKKFRFNKETHVGQFQTKVEKGTLSVVSGRIAKKSPEAMTVETPSAILGVRGTEFLVRVGG